MGGEAFADATGEYRLRELAAELVQGGLRGTVACLDCNGRHEAGDGVSKWGGCGHEASPWSRLSRCPFRGLTFRLTVPR